MSERLDLAVILSTYQRPAHLRRSLASLAMQRGVDGRFEVVVTDDGSQDETADVVSAFARTVDFPVTFTTHPHAGFQLSTCRNDGVRASRGEYLLFTDGDCLFPHDHLAKHLAARRPRVGRAGWCYRLTRDVTDGLGLEEIAAERFRELVSLAERRVMWRRWLNESLYALVRHPSKPKLTGWNIGLWRSDFERVNGFDEGFIGWGCEDDDLNSRLRRAGVRIRSVIGYTRAYHMWHPFDTTQPKDWREGANVAKLLSDNRPIRCQRGLVKVDAANSSRQDAA